MEPSVNMTLTSLPYISILYRSFFSVVLLGHVSHFQTSVTFTKNHTEKKGSQRSSCRFSCTFCYITSHWSEKGVLIMIKGEKQVPS